MNVLITAGGTSEAIDPVRTITNSATGRLGSLVAERFAQESTTENIFYIASQGAYKPDNEKTRIIPITDTAGLEAAVLKAMQENSIDVIVHSMAVSDYRVRTVTTAELLAEKLRSMAVAGIADISAEMILEAEGLDNSEKLSSSEKNLIVIMEPTPKVIESFKRYAPHAILVGFKLLDGVQPDVLLDTAFALLQKNNCTFVLANDAREISGDNHIGYLLDSERNIRRFETKQQIANGITEAVLTVMCSNKCVEKECGNI